MLVFLSNGLITRKPALLLLVFCMDIVDPPPAVAEPASASEIGDVNMEVVGPRSNGVQKVVRRQASFRFSLQSVRNVMWSF